MGPDIDRSLTDAIAADMAFDDAVAAAIERRIPRGSVPVDVPARTGHERRETMIGVFRELRADYADLHAEHRRLGTSPHDSVSHEAHHLRLSEYFRRLQCAIEEIRQKLEG